MTEQEVLKYQEQSGQREFYMILIGSFLHAYGNGAFALSRATGYRVLRKQRKAGPLLTVGFPITQLERVREMLVKNGGELERIDDKTYLFRGIDGTPDETMVSEPAGHEPATAPVAADGSRYGWLAEAVRGFNLSMSTPMDAMLFIGTLQQRLRGNDDACESPAGQGSRE